MHGQKEVLLIGLEMLRCEMATSNKNINRKQVSLFPEMNFKSCLARREMLDNLTNVQIE